MIGMADEFKVVATISQVIIDWDEELASLTGEHVKLDPELTDMPPLEDTSDDDLGIVIPDTSKVLMLASPQPYAYESDKMVLWSYNVDLITRSGRTYVDNQPAKLVAKKEVKEFLAVIKASEYSVVDQLRKVPAQVSLLELLQTSDKHRSALMKVLSEIHVPETIEEDKLEEFVGAILFKDQVAFSDEEIPVEGRSHNKALHI